MYSSFNARAVGLGSLPAQETIDLAAEAGFEGVDLMVRDILESDENTASLRSRMDDLGLRAGAFPFPFDWRGDDERFRRDLATLPPILETAQILGFHRTGTWVMPETPDRTTPQRMVVDFHLARIGDLARCMNEFGIRIGLEVIGVDSFRSGRGFPFVTKLADFNHLLGGILDESPNLGILLDAFHLYAAGETIDAGLRWGIDRVVWVHVADLPEGADPSRSAIVDADRGLPGDHGAVEVGKFLEKLAREGYEGPVTAEPLANCRSLIGREPRTVAERVKKSLDQFWPLSGSDAFRR